MTEERIPPNAVSGSIKKRLTRLAETYQRPLTVEQVNGYIEALGDLSELEVEIGFVEATQKCKFFPNPAEVRNAAEAAKERTREARPTTFPVNVCARCGGTGFEVVPHPLQSENEAWKTATVAIRCKH